MFLRNGNEIPFVPSHTCEGRIPAISNNYHVIARRAIAPTKQSCLTGENPRSPEIASDFALATTYQGLYMQDPKRCPSLKEIGI